MPIKIIIVEDEKHNERLLRDMLSRLRPAWQILGSFEDVEGTVSWLKTNPTPDLIFMDIQLSDDICFSIFDQVRVESMVIFTTAYNEYAIRAFKVNSVDYLLKPIKFADLEKAILKFESIQSLIDQQPDYQQLIGEIAKIKKEYRKRFLITKPDSYQKIDAVDIAYFYTEDKVTYAVTNNNRKHILDLTIESLDDQLDPEIFFRANRSYIVNHEAIAKVEDYFGGKLMVKLVPPFNEQITVSRLKATLFKNWLDS